MNGVSVLIKENNDISDERVYELLGFSKNYISEKRKSELLNEYKLGLKLEALGFDVKDFETFEQYIKVLYDLYIDETGVFKYSREDGLEVLDINRNDDFMLVASAYNIVFADGKEYKGLSDIELIDLCCGNDSKYAVVYLERAGGNGQ